MKFNLEDVLLVVDLQRDFFRGGAMPIETADVIIPEINSLIKEASYSGAKVILSRDWHPRDHISFTKRGGAWPSHCVQHSTGARFHEKLEYPSDSIIISKGENPNVEQYSMFDKTNLTVHLRECSIKRVYICGVVFEYCIFHTAVDAVKNGFITTVIEKLSPAYSYDGYQKYKPKMIECGIFVV